MDRSDGIKSFSGKERRFIKISFITICSLYLLILAGGVVRSTGSGMGCPDWPKCFDSWVPPTSASELPANYKEIYSAKRDKKNQKFASYLDVFGFGEIADKIRNDHTILVEADFNAANTWTEYVNRLLGAVTGFLIILTVIFAWPLRKQYRKVFLLSSLTLVLVGFQGWLGSIVVSTNLTSWIITVHMLLALVIVGLMICVFSMVRFPKPEDTDGAEGVSALNKWLWISLILTTVQVTIGTQVRETIDMISEALHFSERAVWVERSGAGFLVHRSFSWVLLIVNILFLAIVNRKFANLKILKQVASAVLVILLLQIVTGFVLAYAALPPSFQPIHLVLASLLFGTQVFAIMLVGRYTSKQ